MGEFFSNVFRYPKYFITIVIGAIYGLIQPIFKNTKKPITIISLIGSFISGLITIIFILKAMIYPIQL